MDNLTVPHIIVASQTGLNSEHTPLQNRLDLQEELSWFCSDIFHDVRYVVKTRPLRSGVRRCASRTRFCHITRKIVAAFIEP